MFGLPDAGALALVPDEEEAVVPEHQETREQKTPDELEQGTGAAQSAAPKPADRDGDASLEA